MQTVKIWFNNPTKRRQLLTIVSGVLILAALGVDYLAGLTGLRNGLMIAAALVAGYDIALRAWQATCSNAMASTSTG